eukprot:maker-scaffold_43-snap-gene-1.18-mRNA-1 protein AED:0.33 eAED:0.33 QI:107/0.5/0.33/1/1/1/3/0/432
MKKQETKLFSFKHAEKTYTLWNWLQCLSFSQFLGFLAANWESIEFYKFKLRILLVFLRTFLNSTLSLLENLFYRKEIAKQDLHSSPVFILGHFRSGTTMLHNLLCLDEEVFSFPTMFQCANPGSFVLMDSVKSLVSKSIKPIRPMDNMELGVDLPQEDEFGLVGKSTTSPYFANILPSEFNKYKKYFYLENLTKEKETWVNMLKHFLKKVTYQNVKKNKANRLVLKSPLHTARVKTLNEIFPEAKYVFIVRNPYDVFKSTVNLYNKFFAHSFLETPSQKDILELIFTQYQILMKNYLQAKEDGILIEGKNLVEIKYEELSSKRIESIKHIYENLRIPNWEKMKDLVENEEKKLSGYKKNRFNDLDPKLKELYIFILISFIQNYGRYLKVYILPANYYSGLSRNKFLHNKLVLAIITLSYIKSQEVLRVIFVI